MSLWIHAFMHCTLLHYSKWTKFDFCVFIFWFCCILFYRSQHDIEKHPLNCLGVPKSSVSCWLSFWRGFFSNQLSGWSFWVNLKVCFCLKASIGKLVWPNKQLGWRRKASCGKYFRDHLLFTVQEKKNKGDCRFFPLWPTWVIFLGSKSFISSGLRKKKHS